MKRLALLLLLAAMPSLLFANNDAKKTGTEKEVKHEMTKKMPKEKKHAHHMESHKNSKDATKASK